MRLAMLVAIAAAFPGLAAAATISEGTFGDFGNTFATRSVLPAQTTEVTGATTFMLAIPPVSEPDYFAFTDLVPGSSFTVSATTAYAAMGMFMRIRDSAGVDVVPFISLPGNLFGGPQIVVTTGIVPALGELVFIPGANDGTAYYTFQLDAPRVVPEPGTALLVALGLVGLRLARRSTARAK